MRQFLIRRLAYAVLTIAVISVVSFVIIQLPPGDYLTTHIASLSEAGADVNQQEIDALELMGLNPFRYLVVPVLLAAVICMPLLTAVFNTIGIAGGYLVGVRLLGIGAGTYFGEMVDYVKMEDITASIYKSLAFGAVIAWVCCWKGYRSGFGAEGVSKVTTQAVVLSSVLILVVDYFLTSVLF